MENTKNTVESRRSFLKKAAYAAPAVLMLGSLSAHANEALASSTFSHRVIMGQDADDNLIYGTATLTGDSGTNVVTEATVLSDEAGSTTVVYSEANGNLGDIYVDNDDGYFDSWGNSIFDGLWD